MPRKKKSIAKIPISQLRQYRHNVAVLKKRGLISKRIDARKVRPSKAATTRILKTGNVEKEIGKAYRFTEETVTGVVSGLFRVFTAPSHTRTRIKKQKKYVTRGKKVILPPGKFISPTGENKGAVAERIPGPTNRRITAYEAPETIETLDDYLESLRASGKYKERKDGHGFAFKYKGWNSRKFFRTIEEAIDTFSRYRLFDPKYKPQNAEELQEIIDEFEIIRVTKRIGSNEQWYERNKTRYTKERKRRKKRKPSSSPISRQMNKERDAQRKRAQYNTSAETRRKAIYRMKKKGIPTP